MIRIYRNTNIKVKNIKGIKGKFDAADVVALYDLICITAAHTNNPRL